MRYYKIVITDQNGKLIVSPSSIAGSGATYTSFANNRTIPSALQVEFDIPLKAYGTPMGGTMVRIWGITLSEISAATQLNPTYGADGSATYKNIEIYGGMQAGLPLANPKQAGLLVRGSIFQAFGNWVGTDMTLDILLAPDFGSNARPKNIVLDWKAGTPLSVAITNTLQTAFPEYGAPNVKISSKLVLNHDEQGPYSTLEQFASVIKQMTIPIIGGDYTGVDIYLNNGTLQVFDGTAPPTEPKKIAFQDLIGQPTWIEGPVIQFKCVMRGDIAIGDSIQMPQAVVTTSAASPSSLVNLRAAFQGAFFVNEIRHVGNFRQPDAASWVTTFNAAPQLIQAAGSDDLETF